MRIAVCDDEVSVVQSVKLSINDYARVRRLDISVDEYVDARTLLASRVNYDLVFMDYMMPEVNGLDATKLLREQGNYCAVIFLTSYTDFILDAFEVNAFRFLIKPLSEAELHKALDAYYKPFLNKQSIQLKFDREVRNIKVNDIVYIEADGKHSCIHMITETLNFTKTMATVEKAIQGTSFCRINRAFIINMNYVERYDKEYVYLKHKEKVPIGRKYAASFKMSFYRHTKSRVT